MSVMSDISDLFTFGLFLHEISFPYFHFQPICVFGFKVSLCRQHRTRSYVVIHFASLCLLTGECNPFTF